MELIEHLEHKTYLKIKRTIHWHCSNIFRELNMTNTGLYQWTYVSKNGSQSRRRRAVFTLLSLPHELWDYSLSLFSNVNLFLFCFSKTMHKSNWKFEISLEHLLEQGAHFEDKRRKTSSLFQLRASWRTTTMHRKQNRCVDLQPDREKSCSKFTKFTTQSRHHFATALHSVFVCAFCCNSYIWLNEDRPTGRMQVRWKNSSHKNTSGIF